MKTYQAALIVLFSSILSSLIACGGGADAGVDYQPQIDALSARIAELEAQQHRVLSPTPTIAKALTPGASIGTLLGYVPDGAVASSHGFSVRSPKGYLFSVHSDTQTADGKTTVAGLNATTVGTTLYYPTADCSGVSYLSINDLSQYGAAQGAVALVDPNQPLDTTKYVAVAPGTAFITVTVASTWSYSAGCVVQNNYLQSAYPTQINDPAVTGVPNTPINLPVTIG